MLCVVDDVLIACAWCVCFQCSSPVFVFEGCEADGFDTVNVSCRREDKAFQTLCYQAEILVDALQPGLQFVNLGCSELAVILDNLQKILNVGRVLTNESFQFTATTVEFANRAFVGVEERLKLAFNGNNPCFIFVCLLENVRQRHVLRQSFQQCFQVVERTETFGQG